MTLIRQDSWPNPAKADPNWVKSVPEFIDVDNQRWLAFKQAGQVTVYRLGSEVIKIPLTPHQQIDRMSGYGFSFTLEQAQQGYQEGISTIQTMRARIEEKRFPSTLIANAKIAVDSTVRQDLVKTFRDEFEFANYSERLVMLSRHGLLLQELIRYGAFETGFAMLSNFGVSFQGQHVALDFGEIVFDKVKALQVTQERPWAGKREVLESTPEQHGAISKYKREYLEMMDHHITTEYIERNWGKALV
jgi:hypothetical protein